ncbi:hypothetical protein [Tropicimonas sp. IMCC6043]|uniref:hypothetical protein n=1 Tax=Tropicimonas sp. IMCC6043 TaxID=2510645 RepID=UPI00101C0346|nr:hypothetical protein [Tropicimonas sp. IMCC6043]RYH07780.1 hypothetical protein EU800_18835 [Tropicimonas sp. IMCC6043]
MSDETLWPGIRNEDYLGVELPEMLRIQGVKSGGGSTTRLQTDTEEWLTPHEWYQRYHRWRAGEPIGLVPQHGSPESHLSPMEREQLETAIKTYAHGFKERDHLWRAVAAEIKSGKKRTEACRLALNELGRGSMGGDDPQILVPRHFYRVVTRVVHGFKGLPR